MVPIHEIYAMFEGGSGNVVKETGESLFLVVGEVPDDEGDADGVVQTRIKNIAVK